MHRIVVADAARARLFTAGARLDDLEEVAALVHPEAQLKSADQLSDNESRLTQGASAEPHMPLRDREHRRFAREVAAQVLADCGSFERLIVVAPPKFLGALRNELHPKVPSGKLVFDIAKDFSKTPAYELGAAIRGSLPDTAGMP